MHAIAMMMSIALRFIPILIEETDKIMKAQMARGADFEHGNIIKRAKSRCLFSAAFRIGIQACGMTSQGHGGQMLQWWRGQDKDEAARI